MSPVRALWAFLATAPAVALALVAIAGRTHVSDWQTEEYGAKEHDLFLAYVEPLRMEEAIPSRERNPIVTTAAMKFWIAEHRAGRLKDLLPGDISDQGNAGVKGDVEGSKKRLMSRAYLSSLDLEKQGRHDQAGELLAMAARVADVNKFGGAYCIVFSSRGQVAVLHRLSELAPKMSPSGRAKADAWLSDLRITTAPLEGIAQRLASIHQRSVTRAGEQDPHQFVSRTIAGLAELTTADFKAAGLSSAKRATAEANLGIVKAQLEGAVQTEANFHTAVTSVRQALQTR